MILERYNAMNMQELGYFLFMEEQEKQQREKFNVELEKLFMEETPTQKQNEPLNYSFSQNTRGDLLLMASGYNRGK